MIDVEVSTKTGLPIISTLTVNQWWFIVFMADLLLAPLIVNTLQRYKDD